MWCHGFVTPRPVYCINTPKPLRNKLQINPPFTVQQNYHNFRLERDRDCREASVLPQGVTGFVLVRFYDRAQWKFLLSLVCFFTLSAFIILSEADLMCNPWAIPPAIDQKSVSIACKERTVFQSYNIINLATFGIFS